jgi:hypothetical protein
MWTWLSRVALQRADRPERDDLEDRRLIGCARGAESKRCFRPACKAFFREKSEICEISCQKSKNSLEMAGDSRFFLMPQGGPKNTKTMKSKKNLTRFTYETAAFQGWRLSLSRAGTVFTKYFSDKQYGSDKASLAAAEAALEQIKAVLEGAKRVDGKLTPTTIRKASKVLEKA